MEDAKKMKYGSLVNLYLYNPHCSSSSNRIVHRGILLEQMFGDTGWIVLVGGELRTFHKTWWKCKKVNQ